MNYREYAKHINANTYVLTWIDTTLTNYLEKNNPPVEEVEHILDYLAQEEKKISTMSYVEAKKNAEKWTKALQKKGKHITESSTDTETILDFGDGFKIVRLIGKKAYEREGYLMRHCCANHYGKDVEVYSLRDKDNMPHATMEKDRQIKGKGNGSINPRYVHYVVKFLEYTGMTVGDSEMKHLGYVNVEEVMKKEPDLVFPELYQGKYFYKDNLSKVKDRDRMSMWSVFGLFNFTGKMEVKMNFDVEKCVHWFADKLQKIKKGTNSNKVVMTDHNEVAMTNYNEVAMTHSNEVAMTDNNKVAMTHSNEVAMTNYNEVAMTHSNEVAMTNYNEVAMTNYNEVAMTSSNKVAMSYSNEVAMSDNNEVAMTSSNKVAMTDHNEVAMTSNNEVKAERDNILVGRCSNNIAVLDKSVVVMGDDSKVKGKIGSLIVLYEKDDEGNVVNYQAGIINGKKLKEDTWYTLKGGKFVAVKEEVWDEQ